MAKIKFRCACGKSLPADEAAAGKKAKCSGCGQIVTIPSPQPAAATPVAALSVQPPPTPSPPPPTPPPLEDSTRIEEFAIDTTRPKASGPPPAAAATSQAPTSRRAKFGRPWWLNWVAFFVYVAIVWLVSRSSPVGSLLLVMPVFFVAVLIFLFGALWYFAVLCRDSPGQAASLFFTLLKSFLMGGSATAAGRRHGKAYRDEPENPRLARPIGIMKLGFLGLAFALGATILVGILLGAWTKENFRRARFQQFGQIAPSMRQLPR